MGGQQSSRRVTIDNEDSNNVIKVSEKVVERLKGSVEENVKQSPPPNPPRSFNPVQVHPQKIPSSAPTPTPTSSFEPHPAQTPLIVGATATAMDMRRQCEEELRKNNDYWLNRIRELESSNDRINAVWNREYKKAIEEAENNPMIPLRDRATLPCGDKKSVVIKCYKKNADRPLLCADEVQAFSECVNSVKFRKAMRA